MLTLGDCSNNYPSGGKVYIDWNIDGDFNDPGEEIGTIPVWGPLNNNDQYLLQFLSLVFLVQQE